MFRIKTLEDYKTAYKLSVENPETFWNKIAENYSWRKTWDKTLDWNFEEPNIEWFAGGKLNITENCIDRHLMQQPEKIALIWEPNNPNACSISYTYKQLYQKVCEMSSLLRAQGIGKGDRVAIYMPMIPELAFSVLACARIGAVHSVVFAGFSSVSLADRINDAKAKCVITSDSMQRADKTIAVKEIVDAAIENCNSVKSVIVFDYLHANIKMKSGRDFYFHDIAKGLKDQSEPEVMDAEDLLFILYTSGSTGKPKGVVHTCGGYMVYAGYSFANVFQVEPDDTYWCTADVGWITGHTYLLYGPLLNGATTILFEGVPTYPNTGRFWQIIDKHKVSHFYTAPTAIRALMAAGEKFVSPYKLDSLKVLGTVGEPINQEAWLWYHDKIGKGNCPIVDTWWQTETGGIMISNLAHITPHKATYATLPLPGVQPVLLNQDGKIIQENEQEGYLAIRYPWPSMIRTTYGDHERCKLTYFSHYKGYYFTGDGARRDMHGNYRIIGRVDDVINVSGHRFGTAEIENAINQCKEVAESAVVGYPHPIKGQGIYAFVILKSDEHEKTIENILESVTSEIGKIARPDIIQIVPGLPKTRSGKIMRRILRKIAEGEVTNLGDVSTLLDPTVVAKIIDGANRK
jgi:acetyl-CoA synthetase